MTMPRKIETTNTYLFCPLFNHSKGEVVVAAGQSIPIQDAIIKRKQTNKKQRKERKGK